MESRIQREKLGLYTEDECKLDAAIADANCAGISREAGTKAERIIKIELLKQALEQKTMFCAREITGVLASALRANKSIQEFECSIDTTDELNCFIFAIEENKGIQKFKFKLAYALCSQSNAIQTLKSALRKRNIILDAQETNAKIEEINSKALSMRQDRRNYTNAAYNLGCLYDIQGMDKAVTCYRIAAKEGVVDAECSLGVCYLNGKGVLPDVKEAIRLFKSAADHGCKHALDFLEILGDGQCVKQDIFLKFSRRLGGITELLGDGRCVERRVEVIQTQTQIEKERVDASIKQVKADSFPHQTKEEMFYENIKKAEAGSHPHQYAIGRAFSFGEGVEKNTEAAVIWLAKSAAQGNGKAYPEFQNILRDAEFEITKLKELYSKKESEKKVNAGSACELDITCKAELEKISRSELALKKLKELYLQVKATEKNANADAAFDLGLFYKNEMGDSDNAVDWLAYGFIRFDETKNQRSNVSKVDSVLKWSQDIASAFIEACSRNMQLVKVYSILEEIHKSRPELEIPWLLARARPKSQEDQGEVEAQLKLGVVYYENLNQKNEAIEWFQKVIENKNATAKEKTKVAEYFYKMGEEIKLENFAEAVGWYRKAAELGHSDAQYRLVVHYVNIKDYEEALVWCQKAAVLEHQEALKLIKRLNRAVFKNYVAYLKAGKTKTLDLSVVKIVDKKSLQFRPINLVELEKIGLFRALQENRSVISVYFTGCDLRDSEGFRAIDIFCSILHGHPTIERINLSSTGMTSEKIKQLWETLESKNKNRKIELSIDSEFPASYKVLVTNDDVGQLRKDVKDLKDGVKRHQEITLKTGQQLATAIDDGNAKVTTVTQLIQSQDSPVYRSAAAAAGSATAPRGAEAARTPSPTRDFS